MSSRRLVVMVIMAVSGATGAGAGCATGYSPECTTSTDCVAGERCFAGACGSGRDGGGVVVVDAAWGDGRSRADGGARTDAGRIDAGRAEPLDGGIATDGGATVDAGALVPAVLTLTVAGDGFVRVLPLETGGSCGPSETCTFTLTVGADVTLSPRRTTTRTTTCNWTDPAECTATDSQCVLTMETDRSAAIEFVDRGMSCPPP